jgi:hypothetical protein
MTPRVIAIVLITLGATLALAVEMPPRKAGLWEVKTGDGNGPAFRQCIDAATDRLMQERAGTFVGPGGISPQCSKHDVQKSGDTLTIDATCTTAGKTITSHAVVVGSFDSGYTMTATTQGDGIAGGTHTVTVTAKWLGPCAADQKPGDMIMPNGMKVNLLDMQKRVIPGAPPPRQ